MVLDKFGFVFFGNIFGDVSVYCVGIDIVYGDVFFF